MDDLDNLADGQTLDLQGGTGFNSVEETFEAGGQFALLTQHDVQVSVVSDLDGLYDQIITSPEIADEQAGSILYVLLTSGYFHRIRFTANQAREYFHIRLLEATMYYQGQQS